MALSCNIPDILDPMIDAALSGARAVMRIYQSDFSVRTKADATPVSDADEEGEAAIVAALSASFAAIPVVGEESCSKGEAPAIGVSFFLVDALDGTKEYIRRNGEFTVNVGLIDDGEPVAGVVIAPARGCIFAAAGDECFLGTLSADYENITDRRPLRTRAAPDHPIAVASRSHLTPETIRALELAGANERTSIGSSLKFCLVAEAKADFYPRLGPTMEWDTAAGDAVLRAAGGQVTTLTGDPLRYGKAVQPGLRPFENPYFMAAGDPALIRRLGSALAP